MNPLPEYQDGLPNLSGSEALVAATLDEARDRTVPGHPSISVLRSVAHRDEAVDHLGVDRAVRVARGEHAGAADGE